MTNIICFLSIILTLILPLIAQYQYFYNSSWNHSNRQNFMAPLHFYDGIPLSKSNHPTAPPIDAILPRNNHRHRNDLFTTRTTYFFHPISTTTIQTNKRYHFRRRNRTRIISTTTTKYPTPQHFGIVVSIYDPTDVITSSTSSSSTTRHSWWQSITTTTQSFYERFPKLPQQINRPPPPTVPRSFTASNRFTYPSITTTTTTTTTITTTASQSSKISNYFF